MRDCWRIILDKFFNNPTCNQGMCILLLKSKLIELCSAHPLGLCCDNCIWKKNHAYHFETIYDFIGFLDTSCGRSPISHPVDDENSDLESATPAKDWGNLHAGNCLTICRRALECWWYECWKKNYQLCTWSSVGVMPDSILLMLASSIKIETIDDLLEAASNWGYVSKYGQEVLLLLKDTDCKHQLESQAWCAKTRQANKKRKLEDLQADEEQKVLQGSIHSGLSTTPLALAHTWVINPVVVKHIEPPPHLQLWPVLISRPYARTDVFDSLIDNSRHM